MHFCLESSNSECVKSVFALVFNLIMISKQMKNQLFSIFALLALLSSFGCTNPAPPPAKFKLDRPFPLMVGQTAASAEVQGLKIKFEKVAADSRCPKDVQCISAGAADVVLTLSKTGESETLTLPFTQTNGTSNVTDFKGHTVRVVGITPYKLKDKVIKPDEYSITLTVIQTPN